MARIGASGTGGATSAAGGNNTDIQYNDSGTLAGSDNLTTDGNYAYGFGFLGQDNIQSGMSLTIGATQQFIVVQDFTLNGTITIFGIMAVL